jgi:prolyl oligopeptidase
MAARLQAASSAADHLVLLRASADVGHGMGTPLSAEIDENTDVYAFLMHELEMPFVK